MFAVLVSRTIAAALYRSPDLRRMVRNRLDHLEMVRVCSLEFSESVAEQVPMPRKVPPSPTLRAMIGWQGVRRSALPDVF
jgi:hypothetical protein